MYIYNCIFSNVLFIHRKYYYFECIKRNKDCPHFNGNLVHNRQSADQPIHLIPLILGSHFLNAIKPVTLQNFNVLTEMTFTNLSLQNKYIIRDDIYS